MPIECVEEDIHDLFYKDIIAKKDLPLCVGYLENRIPAGVAAIVRQYLD